MKVPTEVSRRVSNKSVFQTCPTRAQTNVSQESHKTVFKYSPTKLFRRNLLLSVPHLQKRHTKVFTEVSKKLFHKSVFKGCSKGIFRVGLLTRVSAKSVFNKYGKSFLKQVLA
jgi:hypothetical protein